MSRESGYDLPRDAVAIVAMRARFPGATDVEQYWRNLCDGVESVQFFTDEELIESGVDRTLLSRPDFVKAAALLDEPEYFDNAFFGYSPRDALLMDPQQRLLLECAAETLEEAACDPDGYPGRIGVFAGSSIAHYSFNLYSSRTAKRSEDQLQVIHGNAESHLATRISYKLNLKGPSLFVQSACSTSLVATHLACQSLLNFHCDLALAGGSSVTVPHRSGYVYQEGGVLSPDGHCRAFDARARGTIIGNGVGLVALKRLEDAIADGDRIHAVIRGSAVNNDGAVKIGYTAPSVEGQAEVLAEAYAMAGVDPATVTCVEAHGTGTELGDPIEVDALTQVFRQSTDRRGFCALGSVKTNFGHLLAAAGVAGLIKAALSLEHRKLPPSLNFETPNPRIDFARSPFYVNDGLREWEVETGPRRIGVSSFGMGGTNAHVVLEEAPPRRSPGPSRRWHVLAVSAKSAGALEASSERLAGRLSAEPAMGVADVAWTLAVGRRCFGHRRAVVAESTSEAAALLAEPGPRRVDGVAPDSRRSVAFLFSGQGSQRRGMGRELYEEEAAFREDVDHACELLTGELGLDLREVLYGDGEAEADLDHTALAQPALFTVEHALARQWLRWGVEPKALLGHSVGELVAACLAEVFSLQDALTLVAARGRLMGEMPPGAMLAVALGEEEVGRHLRGGLALAAINGARRVVVSGPREEVAALEVELTAAGVVHRRLVTSHAFHSSMMAPAAAAFRERVAAVEARPPRRPVLSNLSGTWLTAEQAVSADYWAEHVLAPVRFAPALGVLRAAGVDVWLEIGPGSALTAAASAAASGGGVVLSSWETPRGEGSEARSMQEVWARLWTAGIPLDRGAPYREQRRHRVGLPTYPFDRRHFWVEREDQASPPEGPPAAEQRLPLEDWFTVPAWTRTAPLPESLGDPEHRWLVFLDDRSVGQSLVERLKAGGREVVTVVAGPGFARLSGHAFAVDPEERVSYEELVDELVADDRVPHRVAHLWGVEPAAAGGERAAQERGFYSLLFLAQALGRANVNQEMLLGVVTDRMQRVGWDDRLEPLKATVLGPCKVIPQEYPNLDCLSVDLSLPTDAPVPERVARQILAELSAGPGEVAVAFRGGDRWVQGWRRIPLPGAEEGDLRLYPGGTYLITGGLGGIGLVVARHLAEVAGARLVLTGRRGLPPREEWDGWLAEHGPQDSVSRKIATVRELEAAGAEVLVAGVDVSDRDGMAEVVRRAEDRFGPFRGVIHAAGVPGGGMIQGKARGTVEEVFAPKVAGTLVLDEVLSHRELDFLVLCSSLASVRGGFGQVDYCAANSFLDAFAHDYAVRRDRFAVSVNWGAWAEAGMAVRTVAQRGHLPCPLWLRESARSAASAPVAHPLIDLCIRETEQERVYLSELSPERHWVLAEHRVAGEPTLPGTGYLELAKAAWGASHDAGAGVVLEDVTFLSPLGIPEGTSKEVHTLLESRNGHLAFRITSKTEPDADGEVHLREHARGTLRAGDGGGRRQDLPALLARTRPLELAAAGTGESVPGEAADQLVLPGPRWHLTSEVRTGDGEALARFELPEEFTADLESYELHPAMLDVAVGFAKRLAGDRGNFLPLAYRRIEVLGPLRRCIYSHARWDRRQDEGAVLHLDLTLLDEEGGVLLEIEDYTLRRIHDVASQLKGLTGDEAAGVIGNEQLLAGAILSSEGLEAFRRILARDAIPQVVVSPRDVETLIGEWNFKRGDIVEELGKAATARVTHARPDMGTEYVAPANPVEERIAEIWQELLGIDRIGTEDNFFALGGDSLLAIQVISRLREAFPVEISPAMLFEQPTVALLASGVIRSLAVQVDEQMLGSLGAAVSALDEEAG